MILTSHGNLIITTKVTPSAISDHDLTYAVLKLMRQRPKPLFMTTSSFMNYQQNVFLRDISIMGGGGGYSTNVYTGRLRPEVQPLTLVYAILHEKGTPFVHLLLTNGTCFTYLL